MKLEEQQGTIKKLKEVNFKLEAQVERLKKDAKDQDTLIRLLKNEQDNLVHSFQSQMVEKESSFSSEIERL